MRGSTAFRTAAFLLLLTQAAPAGEVRILAAGVVAKDATWEGRVRIEGETTVAEGVVVTIRPGATVLVGKGAGIVVAGTLVAKGTVEAPIRFESAEAVPGRGDWAGIRFVEGGKGSILERCVIRHAATAVGAFGAAPEIRDSGIENGVTGVFISQKGRPVLTGNLIADMAEGGINCQQGASPRIERNVVRSCARVGILASNNAAPVVRGNTVEECGQGLVVNGSIPPVERNTFRKNKKGIVAYKSGSDQVLRGNRFEGNDVGLQCENFSSPLVERNGFIGNGDAIYCYHASAPVIRNNDIAENRRGIACSRISGARIVGNEIRRNGKGIVLGLSSYAAVNGNNIEGNGVQMELDNMSSDWERRVGKKPERGALAQLANRVNRGMAPREGLLRDTGDSAVLADAVDATGNWWGEKDTAEMERKGPDADIGGLVDYHDVPVRTYEGYPGEYVQDRIRYDGWRKSRIPDAGIPREGKESGG